MVQGDALDSLDAGAQMLDHKNLTLIQPPESRNKQSVPPPPNQWTASKGLLIFAVEGKIICPYGPQRRFAMKSIRSAFT